MNSTNPPPSEATPLAIALLDALRVAGADAMRESLDTGHRVPVYVDGAPAVVERDGTALVARLRTRLRGPPRHPISTPS